MRKPIGDGSWSLWIASVLFAVIVPRHVASAQAPPRCTAMSLGQNASLNGFVPFPADNPWNQDISTAPVDANSAAIINFIGASTPVHPDFGSRLYKGHSVGIPYLIVGAEQRPVPIKFTAYGDESDPGPVPIPVSALIEGYPNPGKGDRHVLVLDKSNCWLYELFNAYPGQASWTADSGAVWDLTADGKRPYGWTSADSAGLPIFPGLLRYDEVASGRLTTRSAIRCDSAAPGSCLPHRIGLPTPPGPPPRPWA